MINLAVIPVSVQLIDESSSEPSSSSDASIAMDIIEDKLEMH